MARRGFRQIQMWVPDARTEEVRSVRRGAKRSQLPPQTVPADDQDFIEQISEDWPE